MNEILAAVLSEDDVGNFNLNYHLDEPAEATRRIDKLLRVLVQHRATLQPPVPFEQRMPGEVHEAIAEAPWAIDATLAGDLVLRFHHPALGWLSWHLEHQKGRELAATLTQMLDLQATPPTRVQ